MAMNGLSEDAGARGSDPAAQEQPWLSREVQRWAARRPMFIGPVMLNNILLLVVAGYPTARVAPIAAMLPPFALYLMRVRRIARDRPIGANHALGSLCGSLSVTAISILLTGGLYSPFICLLAAPVIVAAALFGRRRHTLIAMAFLGTGLFLCAVLPSAWLGPHVADPYWAVLVTINILVVAVFAANEVIHLSEGLRRTDAALHVVRERVIDDAQTRGRSLEALGAKVAHELKNPLSAIKTLLKLEEGRASEERSQRRFEVMGKEILRMETILRDYLSFSRPFEDLHLGDVDLARAADHVVAVLEGRAETAGLRLGRRGEAVVIRGDRRRLEEALLNLVSNAVDATPRGGSVDIHIEATHEGARVRVKDTGSGMGKATLDRIGTPFFTTREQGTGLGLVIARSTIGQHGGTLDFESKPGGGTTVTLTLPARAAGEGALDGNRALGG
jgi:signal transduction histidine kinase